MVYIVLQLGKSFKPKWLKTSFLAQDLKVKVFFRILWLDWIQLMILDMSPGLWKLELGLWIYGLIKL